MARELPEKIDLKSLERSIERNRKERLDFIIKQVAWMQSHPKKWSKEQNKVINWQME
jgi:hypothetical protein